MSSYQEAGVDIEEGARAVARIARAAAATHTPAVIGGIGGFGGLYRFETSTHPEPVLVASTDSVGTKLKVAIAMDRYDTVGIDIVNHCINDVAVAGADPLFFLDYVGTGRLRADRVEQIVGGAAAACAAAGVALIGGETAELPDLYAEDDFDLVGTMVGVVARAEIIDGAAVRPGDALLGLPSTGLHTNGYSLARRVLPADIWDRPFPGSEQTVGEALLVPHRSYLDEIRILRRALRAAGGDIGALAHLTGGGWVDNIPRTLPDGVDVEIEMGSWPVPPIFSLIQERGDVADAEMVRTFNLGIGLTAVVPEALVGAATEAVPEAVLVGRVAEPAVGEPRVRFV
jgi:phosphoribosylformylglycinamidine cyclo-ligase